MSENMNTITEIIVRLREKHYTHDFEVVDKKKLVCTGTHESFGPKDLVIEKTFRYEGDSNPDDMAVIYAITSNSGTQGILIDAYGTYANTVIGEFIKKVSVRAKIIQ